MVINMQQVQITITEVNRPPVAMNDVATTETNYAVIVDVLSNDLI